MYISSIRMKGRVSKRKELVQTLNGVLARVRLKKGCIGASSYQDINDENTFYLVEEWQTRQDMDEHLHSSLFAVLLGTRTILSALPEIKILSEDPSYSCRTAEILHTQSNH